ncbi:MAG: dTDP-4-dehydrorhamnose reductase [Rhodobacteraceae bacterium]|nr:dTDP-4-dehydrorhamnose reductase [Paracoccaceae bacterium]
MTILVFGRSGQLALELARVLPQAIFLGRGDVDIADPGAVTAAVEAHAPTGIINASAWTAVDAAEAEEDAANAVNRDAVREMAEAAAQRNIPLVHVSTDYVFDGSGTKPWSPEDAVAPLGAYGRSKLAGEDAIRASGARYVILRTAWVFSAHGNNFAKTMLRLSETRDALTIVADQVGGPTPAGDLAAACIAALGALQDGRDVVGTYHFSGAPEVSWADFAREIFSQADRAVAVTDIPSSDYPTPAKRPANSRLDCSATTAAFGVLRPDWRTGLAEVLKEL